MARWAYSTTSTWYRHHAAIRRLDPQSLSRLDWTRQTNRDGAATNPHGRHPIHRGRGRTTAGSQVPEAFDSPLRQAGRPRPISRSSVTHGVETSEHEHRATRTGSAPRRTQAQGSDNHLARRVQRRASSPSRVQVRPQFTRQPPTTAPLLSRPQLGSPCQPPCCYQSQGNGSEGQRRFPH